MMYLFNNVRQSHYPSGLLLGYIFLHLFLLKSHPFIFKHHQQIIGLLQIFLPYCYAKPQLFSMPPLNWATNIKYYKTQYFVRPIVHTYAQIILLKGFKSHDQIKNHDSSPWRIIYQKAQFSLAILKKPNSRWQYQKTHSPAISKSPVLTVNIKKPSCHWQYQKSPVLTSNIKKSSSHQQHQKAQFLLAISKSPILISNIKKSSSHWQYQKAQFSLVTLKSPVLTGNIKKPNSH